MTREEINNELDRAFEVLAQCGHMDRRRRKAFYMASEALSAEPCEDCISRQAELEGIEELKKSPWATDERGNGSEYLIKEALEVVADLCVKKAPSVTPKQKTGRWIPVSERLPEDGQNVLFCDIDENIMLGYHVKGRPGTHFSQDGSWDDMKNVVAWMQIPEPYRGGSEKE